MAGLVDARRSSTVAALAAWGGTDDADARSGAMTLVWAGDWVTDLARLATNLPEPAAELVPAAADPGRAQRITERQRDAAAGGAESLIRAVLEGLTERQRDAAAGGAESLIRAVLEGLTERQRDAAAGGAESLIRAVLKEGLTERQRDAAAGGAMPLIRAVLEGLTERQRDAAAGGAESLIRAVLEGLTEKTARPARGAGRQRPSRLARASQPSAGPRSPSGHGTR